MRWIAKFLFALLLTVSCGLPCGAQGIPDRLTPDAPDSAGISPVRDTIVSPEAWISDQEARLALARALAADEKTFAESGRLYRELLGVRPGDPEVLGGMADLAMAEGHAGTCLEMSRQILAKAPTEERRLAHAGRMTAFGDFYGAERIFRDHLERNPADRRVRLLLADLLSAMQRPEEAEGIYRALLLDEPHAVDVMLAMARLKRKERAYPEAERWAAKTLAASPGTAEASLLLGEVLAARHRYEEARMAYGQAAKAGFEKESALGIGRACLKAGDPAGARQAFDRALATAPADIEARYWQAGTETAATEGFVAEVIRTEGSPRRLSRWAEIYASEGRRPQAIRICRVLLDRDPDYFPAQIALAELLALEGDYGRSADLYERLAARFPGFSKILLGQARTMAWSKRYALSLELYDRLHHLNPGDPVPLRERARTALWGKDEAAGEESYQALLSPSVDRTLLADLQPAAAQIRNERFRAAVRSLSERSGQTAGEGYEGFRRDFEALAQELRPEEARRIETILIARLPDWRIQRAVALEEKAKGLVRNKRPTRAMPLYRELIAFEPGNEEARFDLAQVYCAAGLCDREGEAYRELIEVDPWHTLAERALARLEIRSSPSVFLRESFWSESGRGDIARIERFRTDLGLEVPVSGRVHLRLKAYDWIEHPRHDGGFYQAFGPGMEIDGVFSPSLRGEAGWALKEYRDRELAARHSGYGRLWFNLQDAVTFGLGAERADELYNLFGLRQGVQSDTLWVSVRSDLTRRLEASGTARWLEYNDRNGGQYHSVALGYALTDHPRVLKVILSGDYRDTRETNLNLYQTGVLTDIVHPYWTPQNYTAGGITLEWRHDLAKEFICGGEQHYYDIRLSTGTDSEHNASIRAEGEWRYEFRSHWAVGIRGIIHRSRDWDAEGLLADLSYRF